MFPKYNIAEHKFTLQACKGKVKRNSKWTTLVEFGGKKTEYYWESDAAVKKFFAGKTGAGSTRVLVDGEQSTSHTVFRLEDPVHGLKYFNISFPDIVN